MKGLLLLALIISCAVAVPTPCNSTHAYTLAGQCYMRTTILTARVSLGRTHPVL